MTSAARLKHESIRARREARDLSDVRDRLTLHLAGHIDLTERTPYPPGTREKRAVLTARYRLGGELFVAGDSRDWGTYRRGL